MPIGVYTGSKIGVLAKNGDTLDNAVSELTGSKVDVGNADKIVEQIGIDKTVELTTYQLMMMKLRRLAR